MAEITDIDFLANLVSEPSEPSEPSTQKGPLRWYDTEMRCSNRGCSSPTFCKLEGVPRCTMHSLRQMNEMLCQD